MSAPPDGSAHPTPSSYAAAGVDIRLADRAKKALIRQLRYHRKGRGAPLLRTRLHFAGLIDWGEEYLALCADGVGSKLLVADELQQWSTVGIDCVAMNVNDCICLGAEPVAMVDYVAMREPDVLKAEQIGRGLNKGARLADISIVGGETAILPEMVSSYDLSGSCLGVVPKDSVIDGHSIRLGDTIIGIPSSGIHSNGLSLARRILQSAGRKLSDPLPGTNSSLGEELLRPTAIYVRLIMKLLRTFHTPGPESPIHGLAHVTGSGMYKIKRICDTKDLLFEIDTPIDPPPIFDFLAKAGHVSEEEMLSTFNMGMGFCVIADNTQAQQIISFLKRSHVTAQTVGTIGSKKRKNAGMSNKSVARGQFIINLADESNMRRAVKLDDQLTYWIRKTITATS